jgi:hypothetical protein
VPVNGAREALARGGSFNVLHTTSGGKIDLFVVGAGRRIRALSPRSARAGRRTRLTSWVATAEDVVLAKLKWRLDSRSEVQWRDCVEIAAVQELDQAYVWRWAPVLGVVDDLADLLGHGPPTRP